MTSSSPITRPVSLPALPLAASRSWPWRCSCYAAGARLLLCGRLLRLYPLDLVLEPAVPVRARNVLQLSAGVLARGPGLEQQLSHAVDDRELDLAARLL